MPLPSSFWLDETGTEFVVRHGASHPSFAVAPQVPASLYYWLPRMMDGLAQRPGWLETAYRLPSALALGLALFLIARIAARWIHPSAGWFAAFACLGLRGFNFEAADARPYAFGTLIAAAAVWALIRWLDRARWGDALLFAILAALLWRVQLIFWPFYAVFAIYAAARLLRHETPVKWIHAAGIAIVIGAALVPVAAAAVKLFQHAGSHVIATEPGKSEVTRSLKFGIIAVGLLGGWVVSRFVRGAVQRPGASAWIGIAGWWLIPAAGLFGFSHLTGNSVYVDRYLSLLLPGAALAATAAASLYLPARAWPGAAVALGLGVLSFMGRWTEKWPTHGNSDWRAAAQSINDLGLGPNVPVLCPALSSKRSLRTGRPVTRCPDSCTRSSTRTRFRENRFRSRFRARSPERPTPPSSQAICWSPNRPSPSTEPRAT